MIIELVTAYAIGYSKPINIKSAVCMTEALHFEARDQSIKGQAAVAVTILNRVKDKHFPNTVCKVINQYKQFSYTLTPIEERKAYLRNLNILDSKALFVNVLVSLQALSGGFKGMHTSLHYFNPSIVTPSWASAFDSSFIIDDHKWVYNKQE